MAKALIICTSVSHGNTRRVAEAMGEVLEAPVLEPEESAGPDGSDVHGHGLHDYDLHGYDLHDYDHIGFGSGIFLRKFHPRLREFISSLPQQPERKRAFIFTTSGLPAPPFEPLRRLLEDKGFDVTDTFACRGLDTWAPFRAVGGIRKGRPDDRDLAAARSFAERIRRGAA